MSLHLEELCLITDLLYQRAPLIPIKLDFYMLAFPSNLLHEHASSSLVIKIAQIEQLHQGSN